MTETPLDADTYWATLLASRGVGKGGYSFGFGTLSRPCVHQTENIHGTAVLESLIGASRIIDLTVLGRTLHDEGVARWFLMDISPVYNTWHVEYEGGSSDTNLGRAGHVSDLESSAVPMPRSHFQHPSNLIYYDHLPMWGRDPEGHLPGRVDVLRRETAPITDGEPEWRVLGGSDELARIELVSPDDPNARGTAVFDLPRRMCLFYELRYHGKAYARLLVDAVKQDQQPTWVPLTETGKAAVKTPVPED